MSELKDNIDAQFLKLPYDVIKSFSMRVLNIHERRALDLAVIEYGRQKGYRNGEIILTYVQCEEFGIIRRAISPSLNVLQGVGFLVKTQQGRGGNREYRSPNKWRITFLPVRTDEGTQQATHDWLKITSLEQAKAIAAQHRLVDLRVRERPGKRKRSNVIPLEKAAT